MGELGSRSRLDVISSRRTRTKGVHDRGHDALDEEARGVVEQAATRLQTQPGAPPGAPAERRTLARRPFCGDAEPEQWKVEPAALARLVALVGEKAVSQSAAKEVLDTLVSEGGDPQAIVDAKGLRRAGADELAEVVERALAENADAVEKIKAGQDKAIGAIVGAVMRETKGRADGGEVQRLIRQRLG